MSSKISLATINNAIQFVLSILSPFLPRYINDIIQHSLYQLLICFTFSVTSPKLGCLLVGYLLPIYTSIINLTNWQNLHDNYQHVKIQLFDHRTRITRENSNDKNNKNGVMGSISEPVDTKLQAKRARSRSVSVSDESLVQSKSKSESETPQPSNVMSESKSDGTFITSPLGSMSMSRMKRHDNKSLSKMRNKNANTNKNKHKNRKFEANNNINNSNNSDGSSGTRSEWTLGSLGSKASQALSFFKEKIGIGENVNLERLQFSNPLKYENILLNRESKLWKELNNSMIILIDWLKYWIIFIIFEIIWDFLSDDIGLSILPLWYQFKLIILFWLQLPSNVPFNAKYCFEFVIMPLYILDFSQSLQTPRNIQENHNKKKNNNKNNNISDSKSKEKGKKKENDKKSKIVCHEVKHNDDKDKFE